MHRAAEHLIAAAQTEHTAAAAEMRDDVDIEARLAQRGEVGDGRLGARQDNEIGVARERLARPHPHELDARLGVERIEIVEIGDMRQQRNGDLDCALRF